MDDIRVEKIRLEDGRHAERHVKENDNERVVELHCEQERPLQLSQRLVEKSKPILFERTIETIKDGEVVERKVESLDPHVKMELRAHLGTVKSLAKQAEEEARESDPSGIVTRNELKDAIVAAVNMVRDNQQPALKVAAPRVLKAEQEVADRVEAQEKPSWMTVGLYAIILAQVAALAYLIFMM